MKLMRLKESKQDGKVMSSCGPLLSNNIYARMFDARYWMPVPFG